MKYVVKFNVGFPPAIYSSPLLPVNSTFPFRQSKRYLDWYDCTYRINFPSGLWRTKTKKFRELLYGLVFRAVQLVFRNTWLKNNFRYSANMLKIWSRGFDRAQYCNVNQI